MEMIRANGFTELSNREIQMTNGGIVIAGVVISGVMLLKLGVGVGGVAFTAGIAVGLNRKNR